MKFNILIYYFSIVLFCMLAGKVHASETGVTNIQVFHQKDSVAITYDLIAPENSICFVHVSFTNLNGDRYEATNTSGDINKIVVPGIHKKVFWEISKDYPNFNDSLVVEINAEIYLKDNIVKQLLLETVYPGLNSYFVTKNKGYLALGTITYSLAIASIIYENKALDEHSDYRSELDANQRSKHFENATNYRKISNMLLYGTALTIVLNYGRVLYSRNLSEKKFLNNIHTNIQMQSVNTVPAIGIGLVYTF